MSFAATAGLIGAGASLYGALNQPSGSDLIGQQMGLSTQPRYTGFSGLNTGPHGKEGWPGYVNLDPSIRKLREDALTRLPMYRSTLGSAYNTYDQTLGGLQSQYNSNASPYFQAMVDPLRQQAAVGRAQLGRDFARRGIFGDLSANALANYDTTTGREIANQGALATRNNLNTVLGLSGARYSGATDYIGQLKGLDAQQQSVAAQNLQQELSALGLAAPDIGSVLGAAGLSNQVNQQNNAMFGRALYGLGSAVGGLGNAGFGGFNTSGSGLASAWSGVTPSQYSNYYG